VSFPGSDLSEERYIGLVTSELGCDHVPVHLRATKLRDWLPDAFDAMDQPSFDGLNTYVVSRAAAGTGLKVALSGLGSDELFDGYGYSRRISALKAARRLPAPVTALMAAGLGRQKSLNGAKAAAWLRDRSESYTPYELLRALFLEPELEEFWRRPITGVDRAGMSTNGHGDLRWQVTKLDLSNYTKNVLLRDTDAMSMSQSLEVRVPYLDDGLVEWVLRLPSGVKKRPRKGLLVEAVRDLVPRDVLERRKQGFALPLDAWIRGELKPEVEASLLALTNPLQSLVDSESVRAIWEAYCRDGRRWTRPWSLFALARWIDSVEDLQVAP
jgi:asparagine synthase (glutamine-hydrolysing)